MEGIGASRYPERPLLSLCTTSMSLLSRRALALASGAVLAAAATAQSPPPPQPTALTGVRIVDDVDAPLVSILLRHGRVESVLDAGAEVPPGYLKIDGGGGLAVPAFVDAYTTAGVTTPSPVIDQDAMSSVVGNVHIGMREANRKGLQPAFDALKGFNLGGDDLDGHREQGFAVLHSGPSGELMAGRSIATSASPAALRDRVLGTGLYQCAALRASGGGYPTTLMGYFSHLRQFVLDAQRHALRHARYAEGRLDRRPPHDPDLDAVATLLAGEEVLLCHADSARDIRRWLRFADAQGMRLAISGGREAWKVAAELKAADVPVFLVLDWGEEYEDPDGDEEPAEEPAEEEAEPEEAEPEEAVDVAAEAVSEASEAAPAESEAAPEEAEVEDWIYEEPLELRRERRRLWVEVRDCALRLEEVGVRFAFGTASGTPKDLLKNARALVGAGLDEGVALEALTTRGAALLGLEGRVGRIAPGYDANIAVWSDSPFAKKSKLVRLFVDGAHFEYAADDEPREAPADDVNLNGTWVVSYRDQSGAPATLELDMQEDGTLVGTLTFELPDESEGSSELEGHVSGYRMVLSGDMQMGGFSAKISIEGEVDGDTISGDATWKFSGGEDSNSFTAKRNPDDRRRKSRSTWSIFDQDHEDEHDADHACCDGDLPR